MPKVPSGPIPDDVLSVRKALEINLRAYMRVTYPGMAETAAASIIGKASGVGKNTVLRALNKGDYIDIRLETMVKLAMHFGVTLYDLIHDSSSAGGKSARKAARSPSKTQLTGRDERKEAEIERPPLQRARRA